MAAGSVKEITALTNPIIKDLRRLAQKRHREREKLFLTEGLKLVLEGLELGAKIRYLVYAGGAEQNPLTEQAAARAYAQGALIIKTNQKIMEAVCRRDNAQNIIGVFESKWQSAKALLAGKISRPQAAGSTSFSAAAANNSDKSGNSTISAANAGNGGNARLFLALDRVRDPGNLGTIIRTADAAGADGIILIGETTSPFATEAVRASMGSVFAVPQARISEEQFLGLMQRFRGLTVGTHLKGAADYRRIPYFSAVSGKTPLVPALAQAEDVLLIMGNEQQGLSEKLTQACDILARIPQAGRADSLNLAVSAGIMLFEICRPRLSL